MGGFRIVYTGPFHSVSFSSCSVAAIGAVLTRDFQLMRGDFGWLFYFITARWLDFWKGVDAGDYGAMSQSLR